MLKAPQTDNFEGGPMMTFGEHLEELRVVLIRALMGLLVCLLIGFLVADRVVRFIQAPLEQALQSFYLKRAGDELKVHYDKLGKRVPAEMENLIEHERKAPRFEEVEPVSYLEALGLPIKDLGLVSRKVAAFTVDDVVHSGFMIQAAEPRFARLASRLNEPGSDTAVKSISAALTDEERQLVKRLSTTPEKEISAADKAALVETINRLSNLPELSESEGLVKFEPGDYSTRESVAELRSAIKSGSATVDDRLRLNRLVISGALSDCLRPPRLQLVQLMKWEKVDVRVQSLGTQEAFMIWMKASFVFGFALALPWIAYQVWVFVASGLYPHEKKYVYIFLPISGLLFLAGASLAFFFVFKPVLEFLFMFNDWLNINPDPRMGDWMGFVLLMPLGFGISFQLPLLMLVLNRIGIVSVEVFTEHWRVAVLIIFIVAMILTPTPDPYSMLLMAIPLCGLYVLGILLCKWMPQSRNPFPEAYEP
jgi:sec-independent protein translocase protein TatC